MLSDVIAKTLVSRLGVSGSRLIAFMGTKGGVGASSLAQMAALGVSDRGLRKVIGRGRQELRTQLEL